jgi:hypothetical protein
LNGAKVGHVKRILIQAAECGLHATDDGADYNLATASFEPPR